MAIYEPMQRLNFLWITGDSKGYIRVTVKVYLNLNEHIKDLTTQITMPGDKHAKVNLIVVGDASEGGTYLFTKKYLIKLFDNIQKIDDFRTKLDGVSAYTVTSKIMKDSSLKSKVTNTIDENEDIEVEN